MIFFFDLDGPILDVSEKYYQAYTHSLRGLSSTVLSKNDYWTLKRLRVSDYDILSKTSSEHLLNEYQTKRNQLIETKEMLRYDYVWPELQKIYEALFNEVPTVLITLRTKSEMVKWQLKKLNIDSWFFSILSHPSTGISHERWKIKVDAINETNILKNIDVEDCVFVGDTETDIMAGKQLGMKTIGVSFGIRDEKLLLQLKPDLTFNSPFDLSNYLKETYL